MTAGSSTETKNGFNGTSSFVENPTADTEGRVCAIPRAGKIGGAA
jgi:hypothetical protein